MKLWDYQRESVERLRDGIRHGHRTQMLASPTGSGKTIMGAHLLREALNKGNPAVFCVDRVALVTQTSDRLSELGIPHGVLQSENTRDRDALIQIVSEQTVEMRGYWPEMSLLIVDEAHTLRRFTSNAIRNTRAVVVGLSATPFTRGLGDLYANLVNVTTTDDLIAQGRLAPLRAYAARQIDMRGAPGSEWSGPEVARRATVLTGDIVSSWVKQTHEHFGGPAKTLVFSATVAHGHQLCREFQAAGYNFQQISYRDTGDDRDALIEEFRKPDSKIVGLISCEALAKGFDVPDVLCGVGARPYRKSFSAHIQQIGRLMRAHPGKEYGLWLDHSGNYLGFYERMLDLFAHGVHSLDDRQIDKAPRCEPEEREKADATQSQTFGYDILDRLTSAQGAYGDNTYVYDPNGNRTQRTRLVTDDLGQQVTKTQDLTFAAGTNRLATRNGKVVAQDAAGNRISDKDGQKLIDYNHANRRIRFTKDGIEKALYTYNAFGQRTVKVKHQDNGDKTKHYFYDPDGRLLGDYTLRPDGGTADFDYVWFNDTPVVRFKRRYDDQGVLVVVKTTWLHADHLNSPRLGTDDTQTIVWRWDSRPFGNGGVDSDPDGDGTLHAIPLRFPGQYRDGEAGLSYNYFRDYDSSVGRYSQSDPIGLVGALNRYVYVRDNPSNLVDPQGLRPYREPHWQAATRRGEVRAAERQRSAAQRALRDSAEKASRSQGTWDAAAQRLEDIVANDPLFPMECVEWNCPWDEKALMCDALPALEPPARPRDAGFGCICTNCQPAWRGGL